MAGFDIIMGIDNWGPAITTHNINHGLNDSVKNILDFEDIDEINKLPDSEVIIGSPPCVLFSLSNRGGNANKDLGVRLIRAFYRVVAVKKHQQGSILKAWLMENVPNSRNYVDPFYTFRDLNLEEWAISQGLDPESKAITVKENGDILSSNEFGSGQTRKRFVCGEITSTGKFPHPRKTTTTDVTLEKLFAGFPKPMGANYEPSTIVGDPNYSEISLPISNLHDHFYDTGVYEIQWQRAKDAKQHHPYMGIMAFPENQNKPSRTIMATKSSSTREAILYKSELGRRGDGEYRTPTVREAATIMGFPITYEFYGNEATKWRQVGNAVCVQLSFALAKKVSDDLGFKLSNVKNVRKNLQKIQFLDNPVEKEFDKPPKRNPNALFRVHPLKSGNITVDLTNRTQGKSDDWSVIAHAGTGQGYISVAVTNKHRDAAKDIINNACPEFVRVIEEDSMIRCFTKEELNKYNESYGYACEDEHHPYQVIQRIGSHIRASIKENDSIYNTHGTILAELKPAIPVSQAMSIYAMGALVQ